MRLVKHATATYTLEDISSEELKALGYLSYLPERPGLYVIGGDLLSLSEIRVATITAILNVVGNEVLDLITPQGSSAPKA